MRRPLGILVEAKFESMLAEVDKP